MIRRYEVVYILDSSLDEAAIDEKLGKFHALLGGAQPTVSHWGKRTLVQPIGRHRVGSYSVAQFQAEPSVLPEFERAIKLDEGVIRFLVVLLEGELQALPAETAVGAEEDEE